MLSDPNVIDLLPTRQSDSRSHAIERALAESQAIARTQEMGRIKQELQAIQAARRERVAKSSVGQRRRLIAVAVGTGLLCAVAGYAVGTKSSPQVQRHVIEREAEPASIAKVAASSATGQTALPPGIPTGRPDGAIVVADSSQSANLPPGAPKGAVPFNIPVAQAGGQIPVPVLTASVKTTDTAVQSKPSPLPSPAAKLSTNRTAAIAARDPAEKKALTALEDNAIVLTPREKKGDKTRPDQAAPPVQPSASASTAPAATVVAAGASFKVVNILEGTVVVRQGQSVCQVKVGEKMPDGQVLKSVNLDKGEFETLPK